jgi:hypothetical protein
MDAAEILDQLTHAEGLPKEALQAASAQRAELVPVFLHEIDSYLALESPDRAKPTPLFFIFHLLGEWREKTAYRPLTRLLRCPGHEVDAILGDGITSTTHRVVAAVFDGDPQPLYEVILDPHADQFVRSRMCEAVAMLVLRGELDREKAAQFFRNAFTELRPQAQSFVWQGWQSAISMLGFSELKILVKRAFDSGFIDPQWLDFEGFVRDLEWGIEHPGAPRHARNREFTLFGDTIEELSRWHGFSEEYQERRAQILEDAEADFAVKEPFRNPFKGIRRNDRCPCGSGKKFKNCCLQSQSSASIVPAGARGLLSIDRDNAGFLSN